jgi:hypothetical protein
MTPYVHNKVVYTRLQKLENPEYQTKGHQDTEVAVDYMRS